jgi:hypothetical protein
VISNEQARISEKSPLTKCLPCPPLEAYLSATIAQHSVKAELRYFCNLDIASEAHNYPTLPHLVGALRYSGGAIDYLSARIGPGYAGFWIWTSEKTPSGNCLEKA